MIMDMMDIDRMSDLDTMIPLSMLGTVSASSSCVDETCSAPPS